MRYVTHQFAHSETLERVHRWLIHAGITPDRMQVRRQGVPMLAVSAEPGEVDSIEMVISAAEMTDPDGLPSFWDVARLEPLYQDLDGHDELSRDPERAGSFVLAWQPLDVTFQTDGSSSDADLQRAYRETRE